MNIKIYTASPPDREKLVSEILIDDCQWVEINQEAEHLCIEFYPRLDGKAWIIPYETAINALAEAKRRLIP